MHSLLALALTIAASIVTARPPGPVATTTAQEEIALPPSRKYLKEYLLPRFLWPHYFAFDDVPQDAPPPRQLMPATEWLNQEIERLTRMQLAFKPEVPRRGLRSPYFKRRQSSYNPLEYPQPYHINHEWPSRNLVSEEALQQNNELNEEKEPLAIPPLKEKDKKLFALTPRDKGYFEPAGKENPSVNLSVEAEGQRALPAAEVAHPELEPEPPRYTRQNPNLSRHNQKSLVAENLANLRAGLANQEYRLPVSLLPSNLRWLKISRPNEVNQSAPRNEEATDNSKHVSLLENPNGESPGTFYGVALLSAVGAAAVLAVLGFAIGWYTLSKRAKAAADVDYPAYGVTGPTIDSSGDRKLAHSAHMYHYQHQKQQIIAMERNGMDQRSGSVSDPDSEDENEEGDYTVYECPGFATTGDMEVKNPLFNEEPTPATPGKCELVKPQPKD